MTQLDEMKLNLREMIENAVSAEFDEAAGQIIRAGMTAVKKPAQNLLKKTGQTAKFATQSGPTVSPRLAALRAAKVTA